jgi:hypothetical protein
MKVKELIEKLQAFDPEMETMRHGYEGGVENITSLSMEPVALKVNASWYYGSHEVVYADDDHPGHEIITAIVIS